MAEVKAKNVITFKVEGSCPSHSRTDVLARDTELTIDEPEERGGTNLGPSPTETMMGSLAGCTNVIAHKCAHKHGVDFQSFHVEIKSTFDRRGVLLLEEVDLPFPEIDVIIDCTTDADAATMELVKADLGKFCPVAKVFRQSGAKVNDVWNITHT